MALTKTITRSAFGQPVIIRDAYVRVETVSGTKSRLHADVAVLTALDGQEVDRIKVGFSPAMDGANFIKQAYEHLKTLPEFAGAADC